MMVLHSTNMKRIVAKEFLLLVGCAVVVLLVALFGWLRNEWLSNQMESVGTSRSECSAVVDSLRLRSVPVRHTFIELFDTLYVRESFPPLLGSPPWIERLDPLSDNSRLFMACLGRTLQTEGYMTEGVSSRAHAVGIPYGNVDALGKRVKMRYPGPYDGMADAEVGRE